MSLNNNHSAESQIKYLTDQLSLARKEINNLRQQLKTQIHIQRKEHEEINSKLRNWRCLECRSREHRVNSVTSGGDNNVSAENPSSFTFSYIGIISTQFPEKRGTPRQPGICSDTVAKLILSNDVFTNPSHALEGLQEFSHMWILFHFHKNNATHTRAKVSPPRLNGIRTGVFATRSPHRPCPIGLSLVKIDRIMENVIYFSGVDMVDQTPVLDIKPYIPQYDNPSVVHRHFFNDLDGLTNNDHSTNIYSDQRPTSSTSVGSVGIVANNVENIREMDGEENGRRDHVLGAVTETTDVRHSMEESFYNRPGSRMGEREAPDGEEEESPPQSASGIAHTNISSNEVRVPRWIDQPVVTPLVVTFKDRALMQLNELGREAEEKKNIITNVLREDPRSVYLRERWSSHCYVFRIAELYVSCKFNDTDHQVVVYQVFQQATSECEE